MSTPETPQDPRFASPDGKRRFASEEASKLSDSADTVRPGQNPYLPTSGGDSREPDDPSRVFGQSGPGSPYSPGASSVGGSTTASGYPPQSTSATPGYSTQGYAGQNQVGQAYVGQPYAGQNYPAQPGNYPVYVQPTYPYQMQDQRKGFSITSMVLGILSVPFFAAWGLFAILAVIFGHIGLKKEPAGKGMAITGLVLGYIMIGLTLLFMVFFLIIFGSLGLSRQ